MVQETEPRALCMAGMCSTTELYLWPSFQKSKTEGRGKKKKKNLRQNVSKFQAFSIAGATGVYTYVHTHTMWQVWTSVDCLWKSVLIFYHIRFRELNSGGQAWCQAPLPTEPGHRQHSPATDHFSRQCLTQPRLASYSHCSLRWP